MRKRTYLVACIVFFLIGSPVTCVIYLKAIKPIDVISAVPFEIPRSISLFPSKGTCYWSMSYYWADECVIWGRHSGITDVVKWYNDHCEPADSDEELRIVSEEIDNGVLTSENLRILFPSSFSGTKLKDISKEIPSMKGKYGYLLESLRSIDGNDRKYVHCYIDDEYYYIYFSHLPSKEWSWIKWVR